MLFGVTRNSLDFPVDGGILVTPVTSDFYEG